MTLPSNPPTRVVFFQVRDNTTKISKILETAHFHFERKEPLLILTEDLQSQQFVDELLWKHPPTSFLPHLATDEPSSDYLVITKVKKNLNQAKVAFNLCSTPFLLPGPFRLIYEFEDLTAPAKKNLSSIRFDAYKAAAHLIEAR